MVLTRYIWIRHSVSALLLWFGSVTAAASHSACHQVFHQLQHLLASHSELKIGVDIDNTLVNGILPVSTLLLPRVIQEIDSKLTPESRETLQAFLKNMDPRTLPAEYTPDAWQRPPWNFPIHSIPPDLDRHFGFEPQPSIEALWLHMSDLYDHLLLTGHPFIPIAPVIKLLRRLQRWKPVHWTFITARQSQLADATRRQILSAGLFEPILPFGLLMGASTPTRTSYDRALHKAAQVLDAQLDIYLDDNTHYLRAIAHLLGSHPFPRLLQVVRNPKTHRHQVRFYSASRPSP